MDSQSTQTMIVISIVILVVVISIVTMMAYNRYKKRHPKPVPKPQPIPSKHIPVRRPHDRLAYPLLSGNVNSVYANIEAQKSVGGTGGLSWIL
jgi:flagellar basal body-associated protein FliL